MTYNTRGMSSKRRLRRIPSWRSHITVLGISTRVDGRGAFELLSVFYLAVLLLPVTAIAQSAFGLISGSVTDEQDASISGATTQLRLDMFNAFNHTQFNSVNNSAVFDPATRKQVNTAFGQLNADSGPRIIQVALRLAF